MTILERLLRHDAWTTKKLLELSVDLPDSALDREFDIGHRSLRRTFVHIIGNMECWCDLMAGKPQRKAAGSGIAALKARLKAVADELLELGMRVERDKREDDFFCDYLDDPPRRKPLGAGLVHVCTHGMHHRAQCLYIMRLLGVENRIEGDSFSWERIHGGLKKLADGLSAPS